MFIPYDTLLVGPFPVFICDNIKAILQLSTADQCLLSIPAQFRFAHDTQMRCNSINIPVGCQFEVEYKGIVSEIWVGRKFVMMEDIVEL